MAEIAQHYDARRKETKEERREDKLYDVRLFNNVAKIELISLAVEEAFKTRSANDKQRGLKVLDLGCGRGGDLGKWAFHPVESYIGIDVSAKSIEEAQRRGSTVPYKLRLYVNDARTLLPGTQDRDIVGCMFALHYFFASDEALSNFMLNVSSALRPGGVFIGTSVSETKALDHIRAWMMRKNEGDGSESGCSRSRLLMVPSPELAKKIASCDAGINHDTGNAYEFTLGSCVEACTEYLCPVVRLQNEATKAGLEFVLFDDLVQFTMSRNGRARIPSQLKEAVELYDIFVFRKRRG